MQASPVRKPKGSLKVTFNLLAGFDRLFWQLCFASLVSRVVMHPPVHGSRLGSLVSPARWDPGEPRVPWSPELNRERTGFPWRGYLIRPVSFYIDKKRVP